MQQSSTKDFDWLSEVNKTVTHSLITTFGLDFLLLEDKKGGDVDTVHNVRQDIYATEKEKKAYDNRKKYESADYHDRNPDFIKKRDAHRELLNQGKLDDAYTGSKFESVKKGSRHLDHVISAHEIHSDRGRVLSELDGSKLANSDVNLQSTYWAINNAKKNYSTEKFVNEILPERLRYRRQELVERQEKLKTMPDKTPEQRDRKRKIEKEINDDKDYIHGLESIDKKTMLEADKQARQSYDQEVTKAYYSSSKFFKGTVTAAASKGVAMGARQAIGLVLAEIWFELKEVLPTVYRKHKDIFVFDAFWEDVKNTLSAVLERVKLRFNDVLSTFKDSFIGGVLASISTTLLNIVFTSGKLVGKLIRESWNNLVQAMKLVFFNPQKLEFGDLMREVTRIILASVSTIIGVAINQKLATILTIPFGTEIAAFLSALFIGLFTVGTGYYLDHSPLMNKLWKFLNSLKGKYAATLDFMKEANAEIDQYATELARIEFNLNTNELQMLCDNLAVASSEFEKSIVLKNEIKRRNIELPYEMGNSESTKSWLKAKFNSKK